MKRAVKPVLKQYELHGLITECNLSVHTFVCYVSHAPFSMVEPCGTATGKPLLPCAITMVAISTASRVPFNCRRSQLHGKIRVLKPLYDLLREVPENCRKAVVRLMHRVFCMNLLQEPWHASFTVLSNFSVLATSTPRPSHVTT